MARWAAFGAVPGVFDEEREDLAAERARLKELTTADEYRSLRRTTRNAHYTHARYAELIWDALARLGLTGGHVLEPGCGSGNFIGLAPDGMAMTGIERDPITAAIAAHLYPHANIRAESFADTRIPAMYFDAAVGNVPFGRTKLSDPAHNPGRRLSMHNHFIAKSLELTRPGGIVALVSSRYTMDARNPEARRRIAALGDLVAAIRLPDGAHRRAAGTDVVTDLLILRRRDPADPGKPDGWELSPETALPGGTARVNEYFTTHPEFVLGQMQVGRGQFSENDVLVTGPADASAALTSALETAVTRALAQGLTVTERPESVGLVPLAPLAPADDQIEGLIQAHPDGTFTRRASGALYPYEPPAAQADELRQLIGLRDTVLALLRAEAASPDDTEEINGLRATLNADYAAYTGHYGPVKRFTWAATGKTDPATGQKTQSKRRPPQGKFRDDPLYPLVDALEESYDPVTKTAVRADIFTQRVVVPETPMLGADTADEALAICLNKLGEVRLEEIARLLGASEDEARAELGTLVFDEPGTGQLIWAPLYLSGDVRAKLTAASSAAEADPRFEANVAALRDVVPRDYGPAEIEAQLGAGWIAPNYVQQFLREILGDDGITVERERGRKWKVSGGNRTSNAAIRTWGTKGACAQDIAQRLLTGTAEQIVVHRKLRNGGTETDPEGTEVARQKARDMADRFSIWVWEDPGRARDLCRVYNSRHRSVVPVSFDGIRLFTPGLSDAFTLRAHQPPAIARVIYQGSAGLVHDTGAGKTLEAIVGVRERQRLGLSHKPCFVVQKNKVGDFRDEFLRAYPDARLLVADSKDLIGNKRREFIARCATGNPTAIIMSREAFCSIPVSAERLAKFLKDEEIALEIAIEDAKKSGEDERTVKQIEAELENTKERRKEQAARIGQDRGLTYEDTGIDYLVLDEARAYRKGPIISSLPGMADAGSARSLDLLLKLGYHHDLHGETRVCLADATPWTNKIAEIYTWQRYLHYDIEPFDDWVRTFGKMAVAYEMVPGGDFKPKARLREIINAVDLHLHLRERNDFKLKDSLDLKLPVMTGGKPEIVQVPASDELLAYADSIRRRYESLPKGPPKKGADNHLKVLGDYLKASLDLRLVGRSTSQPQKAEVVARIIYDKWVMHRDDTYKRRDGTDHPVKGSLILGFASLGTPGRTRKRTQDEEPGPYDDWNFYDQVRSYLVDWGMPGHLIKFMHEADGSPQRLEQLFHDARNGNIHVLLGSTEKLGIGVNVQVRAVGLVQVTPPWNWDESHQEIGRVHRQFNQNEEFFCIRVVTSPSADAIKWERARQKEMSFRALMSGEIDGRTIHFADDDLSSAEVMAAASGDPRMLERAELEGTLSRLGRLHRAWKQNQTALGYTISNGEDQIASRKRAIATIDTALIRRKETRGDAFAMTIGGERYTKRAEAADRLRAVLLQRIAAVDRYQTERGVVLGEIGGFTLMAAFTPRFNNSIILSLDEIPDYLSSVALDHRELPEKTGIVTRLENRLAGLEHARTEAEAAIVTLEREITDARAELGGAFPQQAEYDQASERLQALQADLASTSKPAAARRTDSQAAAPALGSPQASTQQARGSRIEGPDGNAQPQQAPTTESVQAVDPETSQPAAPREPAVAADPVDDAGAQADTGVQVEASQAGARAIDGGSTFGAAPGAPREPDAEDPPAADPVSASAPADGLVIEHSASRTQATAQDPDSWARVFDDLPASASIAAPEPEAVTSSPDQMEAAIPQPGVAVPSNDQQGQDGDEDHRPAEASEAATAASGQPDQEPSAAAPGTVDLRQLAAVYGLSVETTRTRGTLTSTVHDHGRTILLHDDIGGAYAGGRRLDPAAVPAYLAAYARNPQLPPRCLLDLARQDPSESPVLTLTAARETATQHGLEVRIRRVNGQSYITFCEPGTIGNFAGDIEIPGEPVLSYPAGSDSARHGPCTIPVAAIGNYLAAYRENVPAAMFTVPEQRHEWRSRVVALTPHLVDGSGHFMPAVRDRLRGALAAARDGRSADARTLLAEAEALTHVVLAPEREAELVAVVRRDTVGYGHAEDPAAQLATSSLRTLDITARELDWVRAYIADHPEIRENPAADQPPADPNRDQKAAADIARQADEALRQGDHKRALALIDETELAYPNRGISYNAARDQVHAAMRRTAVRDQDTTPGVIAEPADKETQQDAREDHPAPALATGPAAAEVPIASPDQQQGQPEATAGVAAATSGPAANTKEPNPVNQAANTLEKYTRPDGTLDPERQALHDEIVKRILAGHLPQAQPVATFFGGGSASGKSALKADTQDNVRIDADAIKEMLPDYQEMLRAGDERAAEYAHKESSELTKRIEKEAQRRRYNYVLDGTGDTSFEKMAAKVGGARAAGYGAVARYVTVDTDTAVQRAMKRAERTGRMVPETVIRVIHASVSDTFARAADERLFDKLELLDNNEADNRRVIARDDGTGLQVLDPAAYDRFLAKGEESAYARQHRSAGGTPPESETRELRLPAARGTGHTPGPGTVGRDRPGTGHHEGEGAVPPRPLGLQRGLTPGQPDSPASRPQAAEPPADDTAPQPGPALQPAEPDAAPADAVTPLKPADARETPSTNTAPATPVPGPEASPLINSDLGSELLHFPGFALWLSQAGVPPAAGDLDFQRHSAGSWAAGDERGIEITVSGPRFTRHGLVTWQQAASWIDKGVTPARLGLVITASRLAAFCRDHREQLTAAGHDDIESVITELDQIRDAAVTMIVTPARRSRGAAAPVPPASPDDPAWHAATMITRPDASASKAENAALEQLAALRALVRKPQPVTPQEVRAALRRRIERQFTGEGLAGVVRALGNPAAVRAWVSDQVGRTLGDGYDSSGEVWHGTSPEGLVIDRRGDDRAPAVIRWDDIPAWIEPGLTADLRGELLAADDARTSLGRRSLIAAVHPGTGPAAPSEGEREQASRRLREAAGTAWAAIEAAPPPTPDDFNRARHAYRDTSPVQQTLFDHLQQDSTPAPGRRHSPESSRRRPEPVAPTAPVGPVRLAATTTPPEAPGLPLAAVQTEHRDHAPAQSLAKAVSTIPAPDTDVSASQPDVAEAHGGDEAVSPPAGSAEAPGSPDSAGPETAPQAAVQAPAPAETSDRPDADRGARRTRAAPRPADGMALEDELTRVLDTISDHRHAAKPADPGDFADIRAAFAAMRDAFGLPVTSPEANGPHPGQSVPGPNVPFSAAPPLPRGERVPVTDGDRTRRRPARPIAPAPPPDPLFSAVPSLPRGRSAPAPDDFADIRAAFADLRDILGLPASGQDASGDGLPDGADTVALEQAAAEAQACARWYGDAPEWQRISIVCRAARDLVTVIREAAGDYWAEVRRDTRFHGFARTLAARAALTISGAANAFAGRLERAGRQDSRAWRAARGFHQVTAAFASRVMQYTPPGSTHRMRDARRIIDELGQRQGRPGQPAPSRPAGSRGAGGTPPPNAAALAGSSFPTMVNRANARQAAALPTAPATASAPVQSAARRL